MGKPVHVEIYVQNNDMERAIRRFTKKVKLAGVMEKVFEKKHFIKPSITKRLKKARKKMLSRKQNEKNVNQ